MKNKIYILFYSFILSLSGYSQDKINISVALDTTSHTLYVKQNIVFHNNTSHILNSVFLHSSANSYSNNHTSLGERKLEDRNKVLYFSKPEERGGLSNLTVFINNIPTKILLKNFEFYEIDLLDSLYPGNSINIELNYTIKMPSNKISGYGFSDDSYLIKYFFLQPLLYKEGEPVLQSFTDTEFNPYRKTEYNIKISYPEGYYIDSDLDVDGDLLIGERKEAVSILISKFKPYTFDYIIKEKPVNISLGFPIDEELKENYFAIIKRELEYLEEKVGELPDKIFINSKIKKLENFIGVDDINVWGIKKWELFTKDEQIDFKMFQLITYNVLNQKISLDKNKNHWIPNGLLTYFQLHYLKKYYPDTKLLGNLPEEIKILGIKPLKYFFISKIPLTERYKLGYRYIATQNYDQSINEKYLALSNINQIVISNFKSGLSFNFLAEYLGRSQFESAVKNLLMEKQNIEIQLSDFQFALENSSKKDLNWYFDKYINTYDRINFKLNKFYSEEKDIKIKITNKTKIPLPILITAETKGIIKNEKWVFSDKKDSLYSFPKGEYDKLYINRGYLFPEINDNDNSLATKGIFKNKKNIQLKFYSDVDNPEYTQIFFEPKIKWNNYDKFILGVRFFNSSPFSKPFEYSISPTFSTGTKSLTGSSSVGYNYDMARGMFRRVALKGDYNFYHYDKGLSYKKYGAGLNFILKKEPRSEVSKSIGLAFNSVEKEKDYKKQENDYSHYNLWDLSYVYSDTKVINEWYGKTTFQYSNLFSKISSEIYFRHEYLQGKKITLRFFGGYFFNNKSNTDYFNFGIDHISDYGFHFSDFLGRSATNGVLYQQYIMSEGGFKSMLNASANKWIVSFNGEIHLWKLFDLYADLGVYKTNNRPEKLIYDTGIKLRIIPDFLEFYFPIQSTLGFEPKNDKYFSNIRFIFKLNLGAAVNHFRKGWY